MGRAVWGVGRRAGGSVEATDSLESAAVWRSRLRYYARYHGPLYNRMVHLLVRLGLPRDRAAAQAVRNLAA